jgi:hypothetical protein
MVILHSRIQSSQRSFVGSGPSGIMTSPCSFHIRTLVASESLRTGETSVLLTILTLASAHPYPHTQTLSSFSLSSPPPLPQYCLLNTKSSAAVIEQCHHNEVRSDSTYVTVNGVDPFPDSLIAVDLPPGSRYDKSTPGYNCKCVVSTPNKLCPNYKFTNL